jgi:hypothetical protein
VRHGPRGRNRQALRDASHPARAALNAVAAKTFSGIFVKDLHHSDFVLTFDEEVLRKVACENFLTSDEMYNLFP